MADKKLVRLLSFCALYNEITTKANNKQKERDLEKDKYQNIKKRRYVMSFYMNNQRHMENTMGSNRHEDTLINREVRMHYGMDMTSARGRRYMDAYANDSFFPQVL